MIRIDKVELGILVGKAVELEREACAKLLDEVVAAYAPFEETSTRTTLRELARRIRARSCDVEVTLTQKT